LPLAFASLLSLAFFQLSIFLSTFLSPPLFFGESNTDFGKFAIFPNFGIFGHKVPELIKKKKSQHEKLSSEIRNYLNFIKMGNFSKAVSEVLNKAERISDDLKEEIKSLKFQKENSFKSPPKEWINHRLESLHETLSKNTVSSALALKGILGTIQLEPVSDEESDFYYIISNGEKKFKPYYIAHTKIQTLALLDDRYKSSNWLQWRRGRDSNPRSTFMSA